MLEAFSTPRYRKRTFLLLGIAGLLAVAAVAVGIDDNPPGLLMAYLSATAFVVAFVHVWRTPQRFRRLLVQAGAGFVVFVLLHLWLENLASTAEASGLGHDLLAGAGAAFFVVGTLLCPPAFLVSAVGALAMSKRGRHSRSGPAGTAA